MSLCPMGKDYNNPIYLSVLEVITISSIPSIFRSRQDYV